MDKSISTVHIQYYPNITETALPNSMFSHFPSHAKTTEFINEANFIFTTDKIINE